MAVSFSASAQYTNVTDRHPPSQTDTARRHRQRYMHRAAKIHVLRPALNCVPLMLLGLSVTLDGGRSTQLALVSVNFAAVTRSTQIWGEQWTTSIYDDECLWKRHATSLTLYCMLDRSYVSVFRAHAVSAVIIIFRGRRNFVPVKKTRGSQK